MIPEAKFVEVDCGHLFLITRAAEVGALISEFVSGKISREACRQEN